MEYEVRKLQPTELGLAKQSFILFKKVFDDVIINDTDLPDDSYLQNLLAEKGVHVFVAIQANKVMGGITVYELPMYLKKEKEMYLYDLAVDEEYRRLGVASELINKLKIYAAENGVSTIFVEALSEDFDAVNFYRSTNAQMENVCHFNFIVQ